MDTKWDPMLCQKVSTSGPMLKPSSLQKHKSNSSDIYLPELYHKLSKLGSISNYWSILVDISSNAFMW